MYDLREALLVSAVSGLIGSLVFFVPVWGPRLVFLKAAPQADPSDSTRGFALVDVLCLFGYLGIANALSTSLRDGLPGPFTGMLVVTTNLLAILTWVLGLRRLARARIRSTRGRFVFHVIAHPLAVLAPAFVVTGTLTLLSLIAETITGAFGFRLVEMAFYPLTYTSIGSIGVGLGGSLGARYALSVLCRTRG